MNERLKIFLPLILVSCVEQKEVPVKQSDCKVAIEIADGNVKFIDAPSLDISNGVNFRIPDEYTDTSSILCNRSNLSFRTSDFLVVSEGGKPLMLFGTEAKVVIEMVNGQFRMRTLEGELSDQQTTTAQKAMNEAQSILQGE